MHASLAAPLFCGPFAPLLHFIPVSRAISPASLLVATADNSCTMYLQLQYLAMMRVDGIPPAALFMSAADHFTKTQRGAGLLTTQASAESHAGSSQCGQPGQARPSLQRSPLGLHLHVLAGFA